MTEITHPEGTLVPLHLAVKIVYANVCQGQGHLAASHERFDGLAQAIIALVPLYSSPAGNARAERVPEHALRDGMVRRGGREIRYLDGRAPLTDLFISRTSIDHVVGFLRPNPEDDAPIPSEQPVSRPPKAA